MFAPRGWLSRKWKRDVYRTISQSELFNRAYYRSLNLRGLSRLGEPVWHFVNHGWKQGLSPSPAFDTLYYLMKNDDVRLSQINPLYHFLTHGQSERRLALRSCSEAQHSAVPEASALRYFITPSIGQSRVSVLVDSSTLLTDTKRVAEMVHLVADRARASSSSLRVLYRPGSRHNEFIHTLVDALSSNEKKTLEVTEVPLTLTYSDVPFCEEEESIATSWTSAFALRFASQRDRSFLIAQVDTGISFVHNDETNRQGAFQKSARVPETWSDAFAIDPVITGAKNANEIIALVDVDRFPEAYFLTLEALSMHFLGRKPGKSETTVAFVGNPGSRFTVGEDVPVQLVAAGKKLLHQSMGSCLIVPSSQNDPLPEEMCRQGFDVLHLSPHWLKLEEPLGKKSARIWRVPLSAEDLSAALAGALG